MSEPTLKKTLLFTTLALIAFAANSVLCRLALGYGAIDAASFTSIRLFTGALTLLIILMIRREKNYLPKQYSWNASLMLFIYAICFSFAYVSLDTGTGALILFGAVQITMILVSLLSGNRLHLSEWMGMALAFAGFVYLVLPGVSTPPLVGFLLMTSAGIAWGIYTLKGRDSENPLLDTAYNFFRTLPLILVLMIVALSRSQISMEGIVLAMLSGGLASGVGYTIWYAALRGLTSTQAAVVQLSVPVIAALGGILFVSERISLRLSISSIMILGGILIVVLGRYYFVSASTD
ncbi:MAG: DMT family transporter [Candidatus Marinimicrobia bacterium]|nr:DMT family transporter [Candidatus Neomarinimicrobiota bacterium]